MERKSTKNQKTQKLYSGGRTIKEYIISILCISVIGSLSSMLVPEGEGGGIGKHFRLIFGLCMVIVCLNPIKDVINYVSGLDIDYIVDVGDENKNNYDEIFKDSYGQAEVENLKNGIKQILFDLYGIDSSECDISVTLDENRELRRVTVTYYGSAIWKNTDEIENCLESLLGCEAVSIIG